MAKFNESAKKEVVFNKEGAPAYKKDLMTTVVGAVLTSFYEEKFYEKNPDYFIEPLRELIKENPEFVFKLAYFARNVFYMRSISHVITAEMAHIPEGKPYVRHLVDLISLRPDDLTETLSYYIEKFGKPIPNSLKKGLADSFVKFDEYSLQKYNNLTKKVKLKDILGIAHPVPVNDEKADLWKRLIEDDLKTPITWETQLSARGNTKEVWEELIEENRLGYMALLRNLRNIVNVKPKNLDKVTEKLSSKKEVLQSKQLPFRFYSAYKAIDNNTVALGQYELYELLDALNKAIAISIENMPTLEGITFVSADTSGSMGNTVSLKSQTTMSEIAILLMSLLAHKNEKTICSVFADQFSRVKAGSGNILDEVEMIKRNNVGGGTDIRLPFKWLVENKVKVDRIVIISDSECHYGRFDISNLINQYKKINPEVKIHMVDLAGYMDSAFNVSGAKTPIKSEVNYIAGWSEKIIEFIDMAEKGVETLIGRINNVIIP